MNMTAKTPAQRQAESYARRVKAGWKQVSVWVPAKAVEKLRDFAKTLKDPK